MDELSSLGRMFSDGDVIVKCGDPVDDFFVVQEGRVRMVGLIDGTEVPLALCEQGEIIGDWALEPGCRGSVQLRAAGKARVLTVQRRLLLRRIHEDPTLAFRILEMMSRRLQGMMQRLIEQSPR